MTIALVELGRDHRGAVALVEDLAFCLGLPLDYVRDVAQRVTGQSWNGLEAEHAEAVADLLAEAFHRTLANTGGLGACGVQSPGDRGRGSNAASCCRTSAMPKTKTRRHAA
ncbi:MAG: hypothetical protein HY681_15365 [Chloroflexi bacterium]|nr:hypothetical protein [Chloroflexota bacterium]